MARRRESGILSLIMVETSTTPPGAAASDSAARNDHLVRTLQADWALGMDGGEVYPALADRQKITERKAIFERLSAIRRKHADGWARRLRELGAEPPAAHSGKAHATRVA